MAVPGLLRAAGWDLITLAEHYGVPEDESDSDTGWIEESVQPGRWKTSASATARPRSKRSSNIRPAASSSPAET
ncbi:hypothetical protein ACFWY5_21035 [Nonomuraea sp. NPDC059007]|uniref:hypothetical protein n=1 Tax=Nonomuraea sp. NPDC059007 TaxID=3346692 RepID=UPI00367D06A9